MPFDHTPAGDGYLLSLWKGVIRAPKVPAHELQVRPRATHGKRVSPDTRDHYVAIAAERTGLPFSAVLGPFVGRKDSRGPHSFRRARGMAWWMLWNVRDESGCSVYSLSGIGHAFGRLDHTTVLSGVRRTEAAWASIEAATGMREP